MKLDVGVGVRELFQVKGLAKERESSNFGAVVIVGRPNPLSLVGEEWGVGHCQLVRWCVAPQKYV
jgi:hypothetical protein